MSKRCVWHKPSKLGYVEAADDAVRRFARGERQEQCSSCGLWFWPHEMGTAPLEAWPVATAPADLTAAVDAARQAGEVPDENEEPAPALDAVRLLREAASGNVPKQLEDFLLNVAEVVKRERGEAARDRALLHDLLATVHRDGGHTTDSLGLAASVRTAIAKVSLLNATRDWAYDATIDTAREAAEARVRELQTTVAFFASVIKSGEGWSEQCQQHLDAARQAGEVGNA